MIDFKLTVLFFLAFTLTSQKCAAQPGEELNLGFEEWQDSSFINSTVGLEPPFEVEGRAYGLLKNWAHFGAFSLRTTDAYEGVYAMVLNNWYGTNEDHAALGEKSVPVLGFCKDCGVPIHTKPVQLKGHYKFVLLGGVSPDSVYGTIEVYMTKYDSVGLKRDTIGSGNALLPSTAMDYQSFDFPIEYSSPDINPDTIILKISLVANGPSAGVGCSNCMYFYIDGLELLETTTATGSIQSLHELNVFPNPVSSIVTVANESPTSKDLMLTDMSGSLIDHFYLSPNQDYQFNMSALSTGIYFLRSPYTTYKIIKLE